MLDGVPRSTSFEYFGPMKYLAQTRHSLLASSGAKAPSSRAGNIQPVYAEHLAVYERI